MWGRRGRDLRAADLVLAHLAAECVAVDAERLGRLREAPVLTRQHAGDEALLELAHGVLEEDAFVDHFLHELFQPIGDHCNSRPVSRRKASRYFSRVFITTSPGSDGT